MLPSLNSILRLTFKVLFIIIPIFCVASCVNDDDISTPDIPSDELFSTYNFSFGFEQVEILSIATSPSNECWVLLTKDETIELHEYDRASNSFVKKDWLDRYSNLNLIDSTYFLRKIKYNPFDETLYGIANDFTHDPDNPRIVIVKLNFDYLNVIYSDFAPESGPFDLQFDNNGHAWCSGHDGTGQSGRGLIDFSLDWTPTYNDSIVALFDIVLSPPGNTPIGLSGASYREISSTEAISSYRFSRAFYGGSEILVQIEDSLTSGANTDPNHITVTEDRHLYAVKISRDNTRNYTGYTLNKYSTSTEQLVRSTPFIEESMIQGTSGAFRIFSDKENRVWLFMDRRLTVIQPDGEMNVYSIENSNIRICDPQDGIAFNDRFGNGPWFSCGSYVLKPNF